MPGGEDGIDGVEPERTLLWFHGGFYVLSPTKEGELDPIEEMADRLCTSTYLSAVPPELR